MSALPLYFDFISPYAYLAWKRAPMLAAKHGRVVLPRPILFAALLNAHGHKGPAEIPPKRIYVFKNVLRLAAAVGLPLQPPPAHPFNPLLALRIAGLPALDEASRSRVVDALFDATWGGGPGVEDPAVVQGVLDAAGLDGASLVAAAGAPQAKARLRETTEQALALGVFGVPTLDLDGELFWGYDAFDHVDRALAGNDPVDADALARWADLPASAKR